MEPIEKSIHYKMNELKNKVNTKSIYYVGTVTTKERIDAIPKENENMNMTKDFFAVIEKNSNGENVITFYDNDNNVVAYISPETNSIIFSGKYSNIALDNKQLQDMFETFSTEDKLSLEELDNNLEKIAKQLNISKEEILSISEIDLDQIINEQEKEKEKDEDENKIDLDKEEKEKKSNKNISKKEEKKENPNIKQSTDLNQRVNETTTLGQLLNVPEGGKLVAVYSDVIKDNNNSTKFTFLIQDKDGNLSPCDSLEQVGGTHPTNNIYSSNYDGSEVQKKDSVNSIYTVKNSSQNFILTANTGNLGTIDLGIGRAPTNQSKESSSQITTPLKTSSTYYTTYETQKQLQSSKDGKYAANARNIEANEHGDCTDKHTYRSVDGKEDTSDYLHNEYLINTLKNFYNQYNPEGYFDFDGFCKDFIATYLNGNHHASKEEVDEAISQASREHPRTKNDI